jgi:transcriptional regulator with XRE-family HTH domain
MIEELCSKLKEKRKELGYTIEEVVEKTKLHPSAIRDIEEGNLNNINLTYLKGFIKIYASFLGVDAGRDLEEITTKVVIKKEPVQRKIMPTFTPKIKKNIIFIIIFIFLLVAGLIFVNRVRKLFSVKEAVVKIEGETPPLPSLSADNYRVVTAVKAKRSCFLKVKVDGKLLFEGILTAGMVETWKGKKEIELKISDGSAVSLEVNGKMLPPLTSLRQPIESVKITPTGISVEK